MPVTTLLDLHATDLDVTDLAAPDLHATDLHAPDLRATDLDDTDLRLVLPRQVTLPRPPAPTAPQQGVPRRPAPRQAVPRPAVRRRALPSLSRLLAVSDAAAGLLPLVVLATATHPLVAAVLGLLVAVPLVDSALYRRRLHLSLRADVVPLAVRALGGPSAAGVLLLAGPPRVAAAVPLCTVGFLGLALLGRHLTYAVVRRQRRAGVRVDRALVVGAGPAGRDLVRTLRGTPDCGITPAAYADLRAGRTRDGLPVLGLDVRRPAASLPALVHAVGATVVVVTPSALADEDVAQAVRDGARLGCDVFVLRGHEPGPFRGAHDRAGEVPLRWLHRAAHRSLAWRAKRALDVVGAGTALLLTGGLLLLAAFGAWVDGGRGVLLADVRLGADGGRVTRHRLRTECVGDETDGPDRAAAPEPRVSCFGRLLRRSGVDALPQLADVLRGDLSLVGPTGRHTGGPAGLVGWDGPARDYEARWSLRLDLVLACRVLLRRPCRPTQVSGRCG